MRRMIKRLRSRAGESLAETLVALLISALALLMLAGAISAATRVVTHSTAKLTDYYQGDRALVQGVAQNAGSSRSVTVNLADEAGEVSQAFAAACYENTTFGAAAVDAYVAAPAG